MIVKAIIETIIDRYSAKIRIPVYDQISASPYATDTDDLYTAHICMPPGCSADYIKGDIVYVGFELEQQDKPVILGILSRPNMISSITINNAQSLNVDVNCKLPNDTTINNLGEVQLSQYLDDLSRRVAALEDA